MPRHVDNRLPPSATYLRACEILLAVPEDLPRLLEEAQILKPCSDEQGARLMENFRGRKRFKSKLLLPNQLQELAAVRLFPLKDTTRISGARST